MFKLSQALVEDNLKKMKVSLASDKKNHKNLTVFKDYLLNSHKTWT